MSRPQWGDSMAAKHQFTEFYHWYRQMQERYGLPDPVGASRMRKVFWNCYIACREERPFHRLDELEAGIQEYRRQGWPMPTFAGLITKPKDGAYGVEKLLARGAAVAKPLTVEDLEWGDQRKGGA